MTEMVQEGTSYQPVSSAESYSSASDSNNNTQSNERIFRQSEVNDLIGREKQHAAEKAVEKYKRENGIGMMNQPQAYQPSQQFQQSSYFQTPDEIKRLAIETTQQEVGRRHDELLQRFEQQRDIEQAKSVAESFFKKISSTDDDKDFNDSIKNIAFEHMPELVQLTNSVEGTKKIWHELGKNPTKLAALQKLVEMKQTGLVMSELSRLSDSIKANEQANSYQNPNEPLSQMRPSISGTGNGAPLTVSDYKRKYRF